LRRILDSSPFPIIVSAQDDASVLYCNRLASVQFGSSAKELQGRPALHFFVNTADLARVMDTLAKVGAVDDFEAQLTDATGRKFYALVSATPIEYEGRLATFLSFADITRHKEIETELMVLATTDPLTGVLNRRAFGEQGDREISRARRYDIPLSVLMLDVDHFKRINDTFGHMAGDQVLRLMAEVMRKTLRETDLIGRIGGEEFAAILTETPIEGALDTSERLRKSIESKPLETEDGVVVYTASIGVTEYRTTDKSLEQTLKRADAALYKAKASGRNRVIKG
jgi:diguanylate cyclase (GGDEF)-like protein/PAS domain S-box-containing protein